MNVTKKSIWSLVFILSIALIFICPSALWADWYYKPGYTDYAPNGMPDFDQKRPEWEDPPGSGNYYYCGPVAVANCLWWFDSKYEPGAILPPTVNDGFPLVTAYGDWDDHHANNVPPLVQDLANRMNTGSKSYGREDQYKNPMGCDQGTTIPDMQGAIDGWIVAAGLVHVLNCKIVLKPDFGFIEQEIKRSQDVILLLGFWKLNVGWHRQGGHYVTCAGVNLGEPKIAISDPYYDKTETVVGWPGRVLDSPLVPPMKAHIHGAHAPDIHDDAGNICHDIYSVIDSPCPENGSWVLGNYVAGFAAVVEAAVIICPRPPAPELEEKLHGGKKNGGKSSQGNIYLFWSEPDDSIDHYVVYRSEDVLQLGDSLAVTIDTTYLDTNAVGNLATNYFYVVTAVDSFGIESSASNQVGEFDRDLITVP